VVMHDDADDIRQETAALGTRIEVHAHSPVLGAVSSSILTLTFFNQLWKPLPHL
jgi:hypothetical protein